MAEQKVHAKIMKKYADGVVLILNTKTHCIDYYEQDKFVCSIVSMFSDTNFIYTDFVYQKIKGTKDTPILERMTLKVLQDTYCKI